MSIQKLPKTGDYVNPETNEVKAIIVRRNGTPGPNGEVFGPGVLILMEASNHLLECKDDAEAEALRDAVAVQLGYMSATAITPTILPGKETRN